MKGKARTAHNTATDEKEAAKRNAMMRAQSEIEWLVKMKASIGNRGKHFDDKDDREDVKMGKDYDDEALSLDEEEEEDGDFE